MNLTERIETVILSNLQSANERKIGIEYESIFYNGRGMRIPVDPADEISATDILNELKEIQAVEGLKSGYTLEPGGQIEWASPPLSTIHEIDKHHRIHKERITNIATREQLTQLDYSLEPTFEPADIALINNDKYRLMDKMFSKTDSLGRWMMRNTVSVQINIDYSSREEAEKMAFVIDCLTPIASILFANCPFWQGKPAGNANLRYQIWNATDNSRCGDLLGHGIVSAKALIRRYAEYVQTVPAIFVVGKQHKIAEFAGTLGEWLELLNEEGRLDEDAIQVALHQIFTHVRFKNVIEIRGCDKPPAGFEMAPVAFWAGLLLDERALEKVYEIVRKWSLLEREQLKNAAFSLDLEQSAPKERTIREWISIISNISKQGLSNRANNLEIAEETSFLDMYLDYINEKGIPAITLQNN